MREREPLSVALVRAGIGQTESATVAAALSDEFDTKNPHPGLVLDLDVPKIEPRVGTQHLLRLSLRPRDDTQLTLSRDGHGALQLRQEDDPVVSAPRLVEGRVDGSLYLSMVSSGVDPDVAAKVAGLFGRDLDLSRDVASGDGFRLVFDQRLQPGRSAGSAGELLYAEIDTRQGPARLYRTSLPGATPSYGDGGSWQEKPGLLRTPVDGAHVTSTFGPRLHPILGFTRMHQGVDFGAPIGSPVLAAGDGVVETTGWAGGYGRWLKIRHGPELETGYGHLSAWAAGIAPGVAVRQGQVVAYVGQSGLATGPHLHYEVFRAGQRIDPSALGARAFAGLDVGETPIFTARKAAIDATVADLSARCRYAPVSPECAGRG
jgi:murein DD-endopeptidase MepM/ murein hydrolase activator NlpD